MPALEELIQASDLFMRIHPEYALASRERYADADEFYFELLRSDVAEERLRKQAR